MKRTIFIAACITAGAVQGKYIQRTYNDEATRQLQELVEKVELWAGVAKPEFLNNVEKLVLEGANPNVKDQFDMSLMILLMQTPHSRIKLFTIDMPLLEKTLKVILEHDADINELVSDPFFPGNIADAPPTMIKMLIDHMPIKNPMQQKLKQEAKDKIMQSVKEYLEYETRKIGVHKRSNEAYALEKKRDPQVESALAHGLEQSEKEVERLRTILELLGEPATKIQPKPTNLTSQ